MTLLAAASIVTAAQAQTLAVPGPVAETMSPIFTCAIAATGSMQKSATVANPLRTLCSAA